MTIAEILKNEMEIRGAKIAWRGDPDLMLVTYLKTGRYINVHPHAAIDRVLSAAGRSDLFRKVHMRASDDIGRERLFVAYELKDRKC